MAKKLSSKIQWFFIVKEFCVWVCVCVCVFEELKKLRTTARVVKQSSCMYSLWRRKKFTISQNLSQIHEWNLTLRGQ